jgi:hypothetical protein
VTFSDPVSQKPLTLKQVEQSALVNGLLVVAGGPAGHAPDIEPAIAAAQGPGATLTLAPFMTQAFDQAKQSRSSAVFAVDLSSIFGKNALVGGGAIAIGFQPDRLHLDLSLVSGRKLAK